jgi:GNAT superfamily N-acetyltransferase
VRLHIDWYARHWNFGLPFETKVAGELAAFLARADDMTDLFRLALDGDEIVGAITIDGSETRAGRAAAEAHLRWFIVGEDMQGRGVGRLLMDAAMGFCRDRGFGRVWLWTFAGLDAARKLYEDYGFTLVEEVEQSQWGRALTEQMFEWRP